MRKPADRKQPNRTKLTFTRETLRVLETSDLTSIRGADSTQDSMFPTTQETRSTI
ncbi:hypothetical protein [Haliangium ochraceum]|uniref:Uncharacterized protein n=1 Tax=Haliangium ochraceum (strain DSM 14365 / JCM 11303 / SMP-2) TaxID=502025 RepID=D0LJ52_HALO1|nr:hypothetical protein [Haliangium ochraceum]ACY14899.1 hypothetical protein Hoch_2361 [Haliangium ochraceum DSM 14365]